MPPATNSGIDSPSPSDYTSTLLTALTATLALLLSLSAVAALTTLLWLSTRKHLIRFAHYIQHLTAQDPPDGSLNGIWSFALACLGGVVLGGYLAGMMVFVLQGEGVVRASARTAVGVAGAEVAVGVVGVVVVGVGKVLGLWS